MALRAFEPPYFTSLAFSVIVRWYNRPEAHDSYVMKLTWWENQDMPRLNFCLRFGIDECLNFLSSCRECRSPAFAPAIAKEALPCVRLFTNRVGDRAIKIGASKLGGLPDLPDASEWPCRDGAPLSFIAQINVTALPKFDDLKKLPPNTLLSFFYDAAKYGLRI